MDTIKFLLQKAFENDWSVSIGKNKKGNAISLKVVKKLSSKTITEEIEVDEVTLNRAEAPAVANLVKTVFDRITEEEKYETNDTRSNRIKA